METQDARRSLDHAFDTCAVFDRSDLGRLLGTGPDLLDLLHRLSTGDVRGLAPGAGKPVVITTSKGRIIDLVFVQHLGAPGVLLVSGVGSASRILAHLERYTFAEQTGLADVGAETYQIALAGPASARCLNAVGVRAPAPYAVIPARIGGKEAQILGHDGFSADGVSIYGPIEDQPQVRAELLEAARALGGSFAGPDVLEAYRILRGLPAAGHELTDEHNPLEAGLMDALSFDKGCYVGQEVVARLQTYDKVSRVIVGLELPAGSTEPSCGAQLFLEGRGIGKLTSVVTPPGSALPLALAYVKRKELRPGLELQVGKDGPTARVRELPFRQPGDA